MCRSSSKPTSNWCSDYYKSMASNLWLLREQNLYCDLIIECEGKVLNAHRIIVAAGVEYFRQMLSFNCTESVSKKVKLKCVTFKSITQILSFAYTGKIHLDADNIWEVAKAADFLLVNPVKEICQDFLLANMTLSNCFSVKRLSYEISSTELGPAVDDFVMQHFDSLCTNPGIGVYELEEFASLLRNDNLFARHEIQVFHAITHWINYDHDARIESLSTLLESVRFVFLSFEDLERMSQHPHVAKLTCASWMVAEVRRYFDKSSRINDYSHPSIKWAIQTQSRPKDCRFLPLSRLHSNGTIICLGGRRESSNPCESVEICNLNTGRWTCNLKLPFAGRQVGITTIGKSVYILGGYNGQGRSLPSGVLDVTTGHYEFMPQMPLARCGCAVVQFNNQLVFAIGGTDTRKCVAFADVQCFDTVQRTWSSVSPMRTGRRNLAAMTLGSYIYVFGGCFGAESVCVSTVERFNIEANLWETLTEMTFGRYSCGVAALGNRIYMVGGFGHDAEKNQSTALNSCEFYDLKTGTWHQVCPLQTARGAASAIALGGRLFVVGGFNGQYLSSVEQYDPIADAWTYCESLQQPRSGSGVGFIDMAADDLFCKHRRCSD